MSVTIKHISLAGSVVLDCLLAATHRAVDIASITSDGRTDGGLGEALLY